MKQIFASTIALAIVSSVFLVSIPEVQAESDWNRYHGYSEIAGHLEDLALSEIAEVHIIGTTYWGNDILAVKVSDDADFDDPYEPDILFLGLHHAREWISAEVPYYLAVNLVEKYDTDLNVRALVDSCEIWVVPVLNLDGYWWTWEHRDDLTRQGRYWRKNTRPIYDGSGNLLAYGVDLDRNYDYQWGQNLDPEEISDGSPEPSDDTYWGPYAFSELETVAIRDLLTHPLRDFQVVVSYHSYSQLILYPWGYTDEPAPDSGAMSIFAEEMADLIYSVHGEAYTPQQTSQLYLVSGDLADWVYGTLDIPALTIELRPESADPWWEGFILPESEILATCEENWPAALYLINYASTHPPSFETHLSAGWNMVSFPCLPDDPSFHSILDEVGFYQVLTWDGASYVTPTTAEAGIGYWILVLQDATLIISCDEPMESYELDLPAGWSMIGSVTHDVDADTVFPGWYQLLTWDGTSYIQATTIEPGKAYWALVLEPTHIEVT